MFIKSSFLTLLIVSISVFSFGQSPELAVSIGGSGADMGYSIAVDDSSNIYATGFFSGTVDFDPSPLAVNNLTSNGARDAFVVKLDSSGNFVWAANVGSVSDDYCKSIAVDNDGNVYTTGYFQGTSDFDPSPANYDIASASFGHHDVYVLKLDVNGNLVWAKTFTGSDEIQSTGIAVDASGNVYTTGQFHGTIDFDPGTGTDNHTATADHNAFVCKLDTDGNYIWAKDFDGDASTMGDGIDVDNSGNVYTTGSLLGTADFDPGTGTANLTSEGYFDLYVSKLDANGDYVWAKSIGQVGEITAEYSRSIVVDGGGNVYTTGTFSDTIDFDPGAGVANLVSDGGFDAHVLKMDTDGNYIWAKNLGGEQGAGGYAIAVDLAGNVYTAGGFFDTADFNPGAAYDTLIAYGSNDIYLSKLDANGNFLWAHSMGGGSSDVGLGIAVDQYENVYSTGYFGGTAWFDSNTTLTSQGFNEIFLFKAPTPASTLGFEPIKLEDQLSYYPNPTNGPVTIAFSEMIDDATIRVFNMSGKQVFSEVVRDAEMITFNLEGETGMYVVSVTVEESQQAVFRMVKH
jgi:hypothetical protein